MGNVLYVPEQYLSITSAIESTVSEDTVLVARAHYDELIRFPMHRIYLLSNYSMTGDSADILETIIDGSSFSGVDTATLVMFPHGSAAGATISGFTLTGGLGIRMESGLRHTAVIRADSCSPVVSHNLMLGNECFSTLANFFYSTAQFTHNELRDNIVEGQGIRVYYNLYETGPDTMRIMYNVFGSNPEAPEARHPGIVVTSGATAIIHGNVFSYLTGTRDIAIIYGGLHPRISNNMFRGLHAIGELSAVVSIVDRTDVVIVDNVFEDIVCDAFAAVNLLDGNGVMEMMIEGNVFENVRALSDLGDGTACMHIQGYFGHVRNNIFRNNIGLSCGGITLLTQGSIPTQPFTIEYNLFEACSSVIVADGYAACLARVWNGQIVAHHNVFRQNRPLVATTDIILTDNIADFTQNYWGDPSGPYHPTLNPDGLGDAVGDSVLFDPWLTDSLIDDAREALPPLPTKYSLESYPNPFNSSVRLKLSVPDPGQYAIVLYDLSGRRVQDIWEGIVVMDREIAFTAAILPSGIYFAHASELASRRPIATAKLVLVK